MDFALGSSGITPISKMFGQKDLYGKAKFGGMDLTAHELTAAAALVFGQTGAGIPVAVIRGYEYEINETENIPNTMLPQASNADATSVFRATLRATACAHSFRTRLLLKVAARFV